MYWDNDNDGKRCTLPSGVKHCLLLIVVHEGGLILEADGSSYAVTQGQLIVVLLRSHYRLKKSVQRKYVLALIGFAGSNITAGCLRIFAIAPRTVAFQPNEKEMLWNLITTLALYSKPVGPDAYSIHFLGKAVELLLGYIDYLYSKDSDSTPAGNRARELAQGFLWLAIKWCRVNHGMQFYADSLFVTRPHLNKAVKQAIGFSAKQCLAQFLLAEAKLLLKDSRNTVAAISDTLNFSDPAVFTRFFVRQSGMTPGQYRRHKGW